MARYFPTLMIFSVFGKDLCSIFPILQFSAYLASLNAQFSLPVSSANSWMKFIKHAIDLYG
jgi:hypothetical protein